MTVAEYRYYRISPKLWDHARQHGWTADTQILALYLLTSPHRNIAGLYRLPRAYLMEDLGWDAERLSEPFAQLLREGFVEYDEAARVVLICHALAYDAPANANQIRGVLKQLAEIPATPLLERLQLFAKQFCQPLVKPLAQLLAERNANSGSLSLTITTTTTHALAEPLTVADKTTTPVVTDGSRSPLPDAFDQAEAWVAQALGKVRIKTADWPVLKRQLIVAGDLATYQRVVRHVMADKDPTGIGSLKYFDHAFAHWAAHHTLPASRASPSGGDGAALLAQAAAYVTDEREMPHAAD